MATKATSLAPEERILGAILSIRAQKVMLDETLAQLYGVKTRVLVQAVQRNRSRFAADFMFQLSGAEFKTDWLQCACRTPILRSQSVISRCGAGTR